MNRTKKLISLLMAAALVVSTTMIFASAYAPTIRSGNDWTYMIYSESSFDIDRKGNASMSATTQGTFDATKTTVDMYLEKLVNGKWIEVMSFSESENQYYIDVYHVRAVAKGYNYHIRTVHTATGPTGTDTHEITSPSVWY